ncbi:hypothetical protein Taro_053508 [Colocasia esculenta]|uniref:Non-specific lipid-transfer protein n=1 Tax=Colocasia esculenta TaxID=4460 RepID=A0A843XNE8_COLES|nr:hypothetical protein [Colocasia esculenta]
MASNGVRLVVATALMCLLVAPPCANAAITCEQVASAATSCLSYIRSGGSPSTPCCNGVRGLNSAARTTPDRQIACGCLKRLANVPGLNLALVAGLPSKCGVSIPYPISPSTDCSGSLRPQGFRAPPADPGLLVVDGAENKKVGRGSFGRGVSLPLSVRESSRYTALVSTTLVITYIRKRPPFVRCSPGPPDRGNCTLLFLVA